MIKCIAFDVGNVLIDTGPFPGSIIARLARKIDIPAEILFQKIEEALPKLEANHIVLGEIFSKRMAPKIKKLYQKTAASVFVPNQELLQVAVTLKNNYRVGLLSNVDKYLAKITLFQETYANFDPNLIVLSYQVKTRKPEEKIYRLFLAKADCQAAECLFLDDQKENIVTAQKIGFKTVWFKNNRQAIAEIKRKLVGEFRRV